MKPGTKVKMSEELKTLLGDKCLAAGFHIGPFSDDHYDSECWGCSLDHIKEFGDCIGIVLGPSNPGWVEVDVKWQPSNLKYCYDPKHLVEVE